MLDLSKVRPLGLLIILVFIANLNGSELSKRNKMYTCPENWFQREFMLIVDFSTNTKCRMNLFDMDSDLSFFKVVMGLSNEETDQIVQEAIQFFKEEYGLDFSSAVPRNNIRTITGAQMFPVISPASLPYSVHYNTYYFAMRPQLQCFPSRQGGFLVVLSAAKRLEGKFGGANGFHVQHGTQFIYQYLYVEGTPKGPDVFKMVSRNPIISNNVPTGLQALMDYHVYHDTLGKGRAVGVSEYETSPKEEDICRHIDARLTFTFPSATKKK